MNNSLWKWQQGTVDIHNRYFELKYGYNPAPVARVGIGEDKNFIVEFLFNPEDFERPQNIFSKIIIEIELYLINNTESDPINSMINHTKKCANAYSKVQWRYFPKGSNREIILSKERKIKTGTSPFFNFFSRIKLEV